MSDSTPIYYVESDHKRPIDTKHVAIQIDQQNDTKTCEGHFLKTFVEYCENTSLHGFNYIVRRDLSYYERLCWVFALLLSLFVSFVPIVQVWQKWSTSPVIVTFSENSSPISSLPFPTMTICPSVVYSRKLFDYHGLLKRPRNNLSEIEKTKMDAISLVCNINKDFDNDGYDYFINETSIEYLLDIGRTNSPGIMVVSFLGQTKFQLMEPLLTESGVCYSFNGLPNKGIYASNTVQYNDDDEPYRPIWSLDKGYLSSKLEDMKPYRALSVGLKTGLLLSLNVDLNNHDYDCISIQGFKLTLTNPADAPSQVDIEYHIPPSGFTQIAVEPKVMDTSEELRSYSSRNRHCIYPQERQLEYFQNYTQNNCRTECLARLVLEMCDCVAYYMPRKVGTTVCGLRSMKCVEKVQDEAREILITSSIVKTGISFCDCPEPCKHIRYSASVVQTPFDVSELTRRSNTVSSLNLTTHMVVVYFKESEYLASVRSELYGYGAFIAQCGGLLGLCCGFSILSLAEIIYYLILRMFWYNRAID